MTSGTKRETERETLTNVLACACTPTACRLRLQAHARSPRVMSKVLHKCRDAVPEAERLRTHTCRCTFPGLVVCGPSHVSHLGYFEANSHIVHSGEVKVRERQCSHRI